MAAWIADNALNIIVTAILIVVVGIAIFSIVRNKKHRSCGCSGSCASCGMGCHCGEKKK